MIFRSDRKGYSVMMFAVRGREGPSKCKQTGGSYQSKCLPINF